MILFKPFINMDILRDGMGKLSVVLLFVLCSTFMLYQHSTGLSWDFSVYVSGARWFAGEQTYLEIARPPMSSIIMASLSPFGWLPAEYLYVLVSAIMSVGGAYLLYRKHGLPFAFVPLLILNPFFLNTGTSVGTEAIAMATLLFSLYLFPSPISGVFFGISFLSRYPMFIFAAVFLVLADFRAPKKWFSQLAKFAAVALITISPWLFWNFIQTGDPVFSMVDSYTHNVKARGYFEFNPSLEHFLPVSNILTPFVIFGVFLALRKPGKTELLFFLLFILNTFSYLTTPHKESRYLFLIIPSVAYFSAVVLKTVGTGVTSVVALLCAFASISFFQPLMSPDAFSGVRGFLDAKDCATISNVWVFFDYYGMVSKPVPPQWMVEEQLEEGVLLLVYKHTAEPDFILQQEFITSHPVLYNDSYFYVFGKEPCQPAPEDYMISYRWMLASYGIECC